MVMKINSGNIADAIELHPLKNITAEQTGGGNFGGGGDCLRGGAGYVREKCVKLTCISSAAVTDDAIGPSIQTTGIAVLISTSLAARAHARPTRVSGTRTRVTIVTISAPAHAQTRRTGVVFGRLSMSMSMSIIDLYSTESRSISTALCALSGSSSATTV